MAGGGEAAVVFKDEAEVEGGFGVDPGWGDEFEGEVSEI